MALLAATQRLAVFFVFLAVTPEALFVLFARIVEVEMPVLYAKAFTATPSVTGKVGKDA